MAVTKDKQFVTARHTLQSIWKIGLTGTKQKEMVVNGPSEVCERMEKGMKRFFL
ncbi:hypothetical protein PACILC2_24850 [Paenibacillus cisolokensis]|jgi:hypothetical protein|uniref:Uncharacterized protein n=1 Tax=Paenibacillus cisolokensis TaxID=1658519 RepID=A0ABQ4N6T0_9BACL|nr:hypothetical protein PACILC2_24850 [Paenibacillus cisolokensis]